jgi:hypothetical protein
MSPRLASADEVEQWRTEGWVLLDGLIGTDEIDEAARDLEGVFPSAAEYHADPAGVTKRWIGVPPEPRDEYVWPATGPGFRPEQHRWRHEFPFPGRGKLNRLTVHESIVDFMQRALNTDQLRIYQGQVSAKYRGFTNYEQPMHTDRNHSWLPGRVPEAWWHVETFVYLSDVFEGNAPTHLVPATKSADRSTTVPLVFPQQDPELYAAEQPAAGVRGSVLAYRTDVFHRAVDLTEPGGARFLLNVSYKHKDHEWIGFHSMQSRANSPHWVTFAEGSTPAQLALFGFPEPGHPIWDNALLDETALRYPALDLTPWRDAME